MHAIGCRELAALIEVQHQAGSTIAPPDRYQQRLQDQVRVHLALHGPAHDLTRVQVQHDHPIGRQRPFR